MGLVLNSGTVPTVRNVGLVSRADVLAVSIPAVIDGAVITGDGYVLRGTILAYNSGTGKWHPYIHGTDVFAANAVAVLQDDVRVLNATDAPCSVYRQGFFTLGDILDANSAAPQLVVLGDLTAAPAIAAGLLVLPNLPGLSATEIRLL